MFLPSYKRYIMKTYMYFPLYRLPFNLIALSMCCIDSSCLCLQSSRQSPACDGQTVVIPTAVQDYVIKLIITHTASYSMPITTVIIPTAMEDYVIKLIASHSPSYFTPITTALAFKAEYLYCPKFCVS